jgi:hypothetical protein
MKLEETVKSIVAQINQAKIQLRLDGSTCPLSQHLFEKALKMEKKETGKGVNFLKEISFLNF